MNRAAIILALTVVAEAHAVRVEREPLPPIKVPCEMVAMAERLMIARVGQEFFDRYFSFRVLQLQDQRTLIDVVTWNNVKAVYRGDGPNAMRVSTTNTAVPGTMYRYNARPPVWYQVTWELWLDVASASITLDVDPEGRMLNDPATLRIPDCVNDPSECVFLIGKDDAIAIARDVGVLDENCPFYANFMWWHEAPTFVWVCQQDYEPLPLVGPRPTVVIDANSGEILAAGLR